MAYQVLWGFIQVRIEKEPQNLEKNEFEYFKIN